MPPDTTYYALSWDARDPMPDCWLGWAATGVANPPRPIFERRNMAAAIPFPTREAAAAMRTTLFLCYGWPLHHLAIWRVVRSGDRLVAVPLDVSVQDDDSSAGEAGPPHGGAAESLPAGDA